MSGDIEAIGTVVTGGLIAHEVDRGGTSTHAAGHGACANCGTMLTGPHCHRCGQAAHIHRNAMGLAHDILHGVFHFEGRTWATLPLLALRPGELTRRYIDGERVKFVSPMALFLFSVFLMFAVVSGWTERAAQNIPQRIETGARTLAAEQDRATERIARLQARRARADAGDRPAIDRQLAKLVEDRAALRNLQASAATTAAQITPRGGDRQVNTGIEWIDESIEHAGENPQLLFYKFKTSAYKYSWALIPISIPFIWLLFPFSRRYGLYDHAIFATYSLAAMSLLAVVLVGFSMVGVTSGWLWLAFAILPPIHMYRQLKGTYRLGRFGAGWRTAALMVMTSITTAIFASILLAMGMSH